MDLSLDDIIKQNPGKFSSGRGGLRGGGNARLRRGGPGLGSRSRTGVDKGLSTRKDVNSGKIIDARSKIIARKKTKIQDARCLLGTAGKFDDARQKLDRMREKNSIDLAATKNMDAEELQGLMCSTSPQANVFPALMRRTIQNVAQSSPLSKRNLNVQGQLARTINNDSFLSPLSDTSFLQDDFDMEDILPRVNPLKITKVIHQSSAMQGPKLGVVGRISPLEGYKVLVKNLHPNVSEGDVKELFSDIGPLKRVCMMQSGVAEVIYYNLKDAKEAIEVYDQRQLDGLHMSCTFVSSASSSEKKEPEKPKVLKEAIIGKEKRIQPDVSLIHKALFRKAV